MENKPVYVSSKEACKALGICRKTLHKYDANNLIDTIRTKGGWRKYNVSKYLKLNNLQKRKVCYCRVSSNDQRNDLTRQVELLKEKYPSHEIITDIGSGINFKRKGLKKLIDLAIKNELDEVVITFKDRLCRIGFELVEYILTEYSSAKIIIENLEDKPISQEITEDLIEIITVYSSKIYGSRSNKLPKKD